MQSVRITAAGAVALACLAYLTAPARACDDRFAKQCEAEAVAEPDTGPASKRKAAPARAVAAKPQPSLRRGTAPRVAAPAAPPAPSAAATLAADTPRESPLPDSPLARRFRGFIAPQSMTVNAFEEMHGPRPNAELLVPAMAMPAPASGAELEIAPDDAILEIPLPVDEVVAAASPSAPMAPATRVAANEEPEAPRRFPLHHLVLALCGALGAAAALRFIVGA